MGKEQVYDEQINPLMSQVIGICHKHKIAMLADFAIDDEDEGLKVTTALLTDDHEPGPEQIEALRILKSESSAHFAAFTIQQPPEASREP